MADKKPKPIMGHLNIAEFNRGQSSKLLRELVEADNTAFIQKNGKPIAVVMSKARYDRLMKEGIRLIPEFGCTGY
ncbi:MAG: type II toxin-antitoxin system prevent-host-death family antitoxin [Oscillospiraceae bacterium]|nr:type II toxin-antitoxin system prevent-host-death family antitoxin [Oscillospiraceae bacterium]